MVPAPPTHDYYVTLEVLSSALYDDIKASYRRLALLHHPDKNPGCRNATAKMKLLNAAWEVLQDAVKRSEYDRTRPQFYARPDPPKPPPTTAPKPSYQPPPRPDTRTEDEARAQAERNKKWQEEVRVQAEENKRRQDEARMQEESNKKRQEWLNFEKSQEQHIRQCRKVIKPLEAAVASLNAKIDENRRRLANDVPYAWNVFSFLSKRLSEEEKNEIRLSSIQAESVIRIKRVPLDKEKTKLQTLELELARKRDQEELRLCIERADKERKEQAAQEKAERARQREKAKQREEQEAKAKAARDAVERARQEQWKKEKATREAAERARQAQQKAQDARNKAAQEAAERERREHWKKWEEERAKQQAEESARQEKQQRAAKEARARTSSCRHKGWWKDLQGQYTCAHCTRPLYKFASQCPGCRTIACASCRNKLKQGVKPPSTYQHEPGRNAKGKRRSTAEQPLPNGFTHCEDPLDHSYNDYDDY